MHLHRITQIDLDALHFRGLKGLFLIATLNDLRGQEDQQLFPDLRVLVEAEQASDERDITQERNFAIHGRFVRGDHSPEHNRLPCRADTVV